MFVSAQLLSVCREFGPTIQGLTDNGQPVDGSRLLAAISVLESSGGTKREYVKYETAYLPGGKYYKDSEPLREMYNRYGVLASSSFGSFQLMFMTATEMGFQGHPIELQEDRKCAFWATELINKRFIARLKAKTLRDIFDSYNSGYHADRYIPTVYITRGEKAYREFTTI